MTRTNRAALLVAVCVPLLLAPGCAKVRPRLDPTPWFAATADMATADSLVRAGCYVCLTQAFAIYTRLSSPPAEIASARFRALDTAILLGMRERELGLGKGRWRAIAEQLARDLPPPIDYSPYISMVDAIGWSRLGVSAEQQDTILAAQRMVSDNFQTWRTNLLTQVPRDLLSSYALISLDCLYTYRLSQTKQKPWPMPADAPPLLRFRAATCTGAKPEDLDVLVRDEPRLKDAYLALGERALARGTLRTAERHLLTALEDIPELMAAKLLLGVVAFQMEDIESALTFYHDVTAAVPGQRDAMLGEAKALSYLSRHDEAIAILDDMVKLGTWFLGDAHYWLSWNRYRLKQYDVANDEVLVSRKFLPMDPNVDKLAGLIALSRTEIERAEREFRLAVEHFEGRQSRDCDSYYYLASVLVTLRKWPEGAERFSKSLPCYVTDEQDVRRRIDEIKAADLPEERKVRLVAAKEKIIPVLQAQQARVAYNAAVAYANQGDKDKARPLAERAAQHPEWADLAQKLLARLQPG